MIIFPSYDVQASLISWKTTHFLHHDKDQWNVLKLILFELGMSNSMTFALLSIGLFLYRRKFLNHPISKVL